MKKIFRTLVLAITIGGVAALPTAFAEDAPTTPALTPVYATDMVSIIMGEPNFAVNGAYHELEEGLLTKAVMVDDSVLAPLQDIIGTLGGTFQWDEVAKKTTVVLNGSTLVLTMGERVASVNGQPKTAPVSSRVTDGRVFLPVRFVMESVGCLVSWDANRTRITATYTHPEAAAGSGGMAKGGKVTFATMIDQPAQWYGSDEAKQVADNILGFQNKDGGWIKLETDVDMTKPISGTGALNVKVQSTIDNDATFSEMSFLAKVYNASKVEKYRNSFYKGLDYVQSGQYGNGGWPQFFPGGVGYQSHITLNDNVMINILEVMRDVANRTVDYAYVDDAYAAKAKVAYDKGVTLLLKLQISTDGKKTGWAQQYDENSLEPTVGRAYELASVSSLESVGVIRFLMSIDKPSAEVVDAVQSAVAWLNEVKITGVKVGKKVDPTLEFGSDRVLVNDAKAPLLWARFYEIGTYKPIFSSRDGVKKYDMADISYERRNKYSWYNSTPANLLANDYPLWQQKWAPDNNVLK
ncbi:pectate lyase [Paenibacillus aceris]|uniref:PelA/Pel-15E family pectate lyase n=1 Tax=Paenibacillus aceris TaxID=869555 RepID=A0ABS4I9P8_9BACL|nr:pectate lyase [Paenibacillus aceris]MBP1967662.1 PelA/Pel-15E family pectate lyase [Paenibacillus aceris]NHW37529.1 pectate lyase [Paenibacillus aceris]